MTEATRGAPWYLRLGAWIGVGTSPGALMVGGGIAASTSSPWRVPGTMLGVLAITVLAVLSAHKGHAARAPIVVLSRRAFGGARGEQIVAVFILLGVCGWSGLYMGVSVGALQQLWGWSTVLTAGALGGGLWLLYGTGFRSWNTMVGLTGAASLGVAVLVSRDVVRADSTAAGPLLDGPGALLFGVGVVIAYAAVFALRAPDFTWDARHRADVVKAGAVFAVALLAFLLLGVEIYDRAGSFDLATLVNKTRTPAVGALLLLLAAIAPIVSGLHSGALSARQLLGWREAKGAATIALAAAVLGASRFDLYLLPFLRLLGAVMPPLLGVILAPAGRRRGWHAWTGWAAGSLTSLALLRADYPIHILGGILVSGTTMLVLRATVPPCRSPGGSTCTAE